MTRRLGAVLCLLAVLPLAGCRLHVMRMNVERPLSEQAFQAIELGADDRTAVLARLGPPDRILYGRTEEILVYEAASHRSTDLLFYFPTDVLGGFRVIVPLGALRYFFDPFEEPEGLRPPLLAEYGRRTVDSTRSLVPFATGIDLLVMHARQLRSDELQVVLDRETRSTLRKTLRLATGEFADETLPERLILQAD